MSFQNAYTHRKVAETSARGCEICFKPSTSVLITPDNKDFFYVCPSHLKDRGFCSPIIDEEAVKAKEEKQRAAEAEKLRKETEEKEKKEKDKEEEAKLKELKGDKKKVIEYYEQKLKREAKEREEKAKDGKADESRGDQGDKASAASSLAEDEEPRVFALQRVFYQGRIDKKRQGEIAKRNRERMRDPSFFPSVPKGAP